MRPLSMLLLCSALGSVATAGVGCSRNYIANTDVEDTPEHRAIVGFCEEYRKAVERKDVVALLRLASPKYYEDGGNIDASDDIDYAGLKEYLASKFLEARAVRYEVRYRRILREDDRVYVDYTFSASYKLPTAVGEEWRRKVDDNRLELVPDRDRFLIVAGM